VDALGVTQITGRRVRIASSCPACGRAIQVTVEPDAVIRARPSAARVWNGARARTGPLVNRH
jgi:hypothetical protein